MPRRNPARNAQPDLAGGLKRMWDAIERKAQRCIFCCGRLGFKAMHERLVLYAGPRASVMLNRYPCSSGHLLVAPRSHTASPELRDRDERRTLGELVTIATAHLRQAYRPAGINIGANLGRAAGASFGRSHALASGAALGR
jgi:ATP adenylyltransferase